MISKIFDKYRAFPIQMKASFWFLVCAFLQRGISAITTPIFTRLMTTTEYGQYNIFNSWMSIVTCFVTLNLYGGVYAQGLIKFGDRRKCFSSSFQGLVLTLTLFWTGIYIIFRPVLNPLLGISTLQGLLMLVLIWATGVFQLWAQEQRAMFCYRSLVAVTLIYCIVAPALSIFFITRSSDKVTARIIGMAVASVGAYGWMFFSQYKKGRTFYSSKIWKYALELALPLIPHYLSQMILNSSDRIMISHILGDSEAGIYSLAYSVSLIMTMFNTSLLSTIEPWIYQKIKEKETYKIRKIAYPSFLLIGAVNLLLIAFSPEVIRIFAPAEYYEAIWVIPPIAMSVFFMFSYSFFAMFEFYFEKTKYITAATLTGAFINIIMNFIFIRIFGYFAAGYTTLACYIIYAIMHYTFMQKICKENLDGAEVYDKRILVEIALVFMAMSFVIMVTYEFPVIRYSIIMAMAVILWLFRNKIADMLRMMLHARNDAKRA